MASRLVAAHRLLGRLTASAVPGQGLPCTLQLAAWFSTGASPPPFDAAEVARALRCHELHEDIQALAEKHPSMPYPELLAAVQQRGLTPAAAEDAVGRLERSGALLNLAGTVLLRPGEVAEALALVLPTTPAETRQRLQYVGSELSGLEEQQAAIARRAVWRQRRLLWGGLVSQSLLWVGLFRLTFYELSWDVMEPICFFVGGGQAMACYAYFMFTRRDFTWEGALERQAGQWEKQQLAAANFPLHRYSWLKRETQRLSDLLAVQERQEAAAQAAAAQADAGAVAESKKEA